ncbi:nucleotidyltransferase family protein [Rhizobium sp. TH2]|uniref:nucleotidyltransferase family protein n=1 Tax=Rhizobium sp. TH2 TaxID=2775403 RepID=UPI0021586DD5|nr:nucleotidyltransferase family protein [Rhizobium sp. TH2]UVC08492.1 nucleotidyltransferase family protein [Rhizobium sp. TH2]
MSKRIRHAMVLAAGLGMRMRPITDTIPKPLVKIAGKPLIDYALDTLKDAGCETAVVNVHYLAEQMEAHLAEYKGMEILISDERDVLLNSGGGLAKGLKLLPDVEVFVMNSDLFWIGETPGQPTNLEMLAGFFDADRMDMAMLCVRLEDTTGHDGKVDFAMDDDGRLVRYRPVDGVMPAGEGVVYAGAIAMRSSLLADAPDGAFNLNIYFDRAIAANRLYGLILQGHWVTAGTPEAIGAAEEAVRRYS